MSNKYKFFNKLNTISALALLFLMLTYFITGYGMTKNIIDRGFATYLHTEILPIPIIIFFIIHAALGIRILLKRWRLFDDKVIKYISLLILMAIFLFLIYLEMA